MSGITETMLVTVACRAEDASSAQPLLGDQWAKHVLDQVEYEPSPHKNFNRIIVIRGRLLDAWATEFLEAHPDATVLQLACGLDSRALRLYRARVWGGSTWIYPRRWSCARQLLPTPPGDYKLVASSVLEEAWLEEIPDDRPTLVIIEGLTQYLEAAELELLIQRLCDRFPAGGQIVFDAVGKLHLRLQANNGAIQKTGARYQNSIDGPSDFVKFHPSLKPKSISYIWQLPGTERAPLVLRFMYRMSRWIPLLRTYYSIQRYTFEATSHGGS